jgi:opacity protein-like surface antigen
MKSRFLLALCAAALLSGVSAASADDQTIQSNLTLSGFNNSNIMTAFKTTDAFDAVHSCTTGSSSNCTAQNGYGSPPKNVGNILCMPSNLVYAITSGCQAILSSGSSQGCKGNPIQGLCGGNANVTAACAWRTNNNKSTTTWNWNLSYSGGVVNVDCSNSNYQGYTP